MGVNSKALLICIASVPAFALVPSMASADSNDTLAEQQQVDETLFQVLGAPGEMERIERRAIIEPAMLSGIHMDDLNEHMAIRGFKKAPNNRYFYNHDMSDFASMDEVYLGHLSVPGDCRRVYIIGVTKAQNGLVAEMTGTQVATVCR